MSKRLRRHINVATLSNLPSWSTIPARRGAELHAALKAAGYVGLQTFGPNPEAQAAGLELSGSGRAFKPEDLDGIAAQHKSWGMVGTTLTVGDGLETDLEMDRLAAAILETQNKHAYPLFLETHRASITQDLRRTIDLALRFPDLRFNADLSHWYVGHELGAGDFAAKCEALAPVLSRVRFVHGRIGDTCSAQTPLTDGEGRERPQVAHYRDLWTRCFRGFLADPDAGETIIIAPELLPNVANFGGKTYQLNYARLLPDGREETDRWADALRICAIAEECFAQAEA